MQRQEVLLTELARLAKEGFAKAEEEWEKSVIAWGAWTSTLHPHPLTDPSCRQTTREAACRSRIRR